MLRAIRLTCPRLKDATFGEKKEEGLAPPASKRALLDTGEHQQLELELSKWPKVKFIYSKSSISVSYFNNNFLFFII